MTYNEAIKLWHVLLVMAKYEHVLACCGCVPGHQCVSLS